MGEPRAAPSARLLLRLSTALVLTLVASASGQVQAAGHRAEPGVLPTSFSSVTGPALPRNAALRAPAGSPGAPLITSVAGVGLGILVNWAPASAADGVTTYPSRQLRPIHRAARRSQ